LRKIIIYLLRKIIIYLLREIILISLNNNKMILAAVKH
jgi:hypothetical protein